MTFGSVPRPLARQHCRFPPRHPGNATRFAADVIAESCRVLSFTSQEVVLKVHPLACVLVAVLLVTAAPAFARSDAGPAGNFPGLTTAPYPGTLTLAVDLTDAPRKIFRVQEAIPVAQPGPLTLYYPKWIPGEHSPSGPLENVVGLVIRGNGQRLAWRRDLRDMYAVHLEVPAGVSTLDVSFQFLSPTGGGEFGQSVSATPRLVDLEWNQVVMYPAGHYARSYTVAASVTLPAGWKYGTALDTASAAGGRVDFKPVPLNHLVDSPLIAGEYFKRVDLDPGAKVPVHLDIVADGAKNLALGDKQLGDFRALVQQAYKTFGTHHYNHYTFLLTLSDNTGHFGLEHHQSSDDRLGADYLTDAQSGLLGADLLPHEYTHSWNGKFRRPADLWAPDFNSVPEQDDLLWVYEGLTQYYGDVLAARSGLWNPRQYREMLASTLANMAARPGRRWRPLQDTADEASILYYVPGGWANWRRQVDFYPEGELLWLDVDTRIRELSHGRRSLDDFARAFFGIHPGSDVTVTYTFDDIVKALDGVAPYDWAAFLRKRLDYVGNELPERDGVARSGWKLAWTDQPDSYQKALEAQRHVVNLMYGAGMTVATKDGKLDDVLWDGPAFKAGLAPGMRILAVDGRQFSAQVLKDAVSDAARSQQPIDLLVKNLEYVSTVRIDYHGGLRYPVLERIKGTPDRLDAIVRALR